MKPAGLNAKRCLNGFDVKGIIADKAEMAQIDKRCD